MTPERLRELRASASRRRDALLTEALDEIERLEREVVAAERKSIDNASHFAALGVLTATPQEALRAAFPEMQAHIADLERELADTRRDMRALQAELDRRP